MSLRWRILGSIVVVVLLSVLASIAVGYYATQFRLDAFVDRLGGDEAVQLAGRLSREYSATGSWATAGEVLAEAGYGLIQSGQDDEHESERGESAELFHRDPIRVVIIDLEGRVVLDNRQQIPPGTGITDLGGHREAVFDQTANQPVGHVYLDVEQENLATESHGFLSALLYNALIGGALTAGVAILLAAWLSKRITAPVNALTQATQAIADGEAAQLPITSSDELGRMSAAFNRMSAALEAQRDLRKRLVDDVSHEINSPLSVIKLEAKALGDGLQPPAAASRQIIEEVDRLRGLVSDLDWLAETEQGEFKLSPEPTSLHDMLSAELDRWQPLCQARQIGLSLQIDGESPVLDIDRLRMGQALANILNNAINCTESGGTIRVVTGSDRNGSVILSIVDDGIGIAPEDLDRVFDRFYCTRQSRDRGISGKGLGLAIARAIVDAHGGTINLSSDGPGQGTTVTLRLPAFG